MSEPVCTDQDPEIQIGEHKVNPTVLDHSKFILHDINFLFKVIIHSHYQYAFTIALYENIILLKYVSNSYLVLIHFSKEYFIG